jgi:biopolymer transport protein ExbB
MKRLSRSIILMTIASILLLSRAASAQAPGSVLPHNLSVWGMFLNADLVVQAVMVGLAFASLVTWTVWLAKTIEIRREVSRARARIKMLEAGIDLSEAVRRCGNARDAVAQIIGSAAAEAGLSDGHLYESFRERVVLRLERVEQAMTRQVTRGTGILATIGATAPFVGLFGTVWGIMNAFIGISQSQTTNLAVVAPGIAEALLATAMGLVAAIPAVVIYNHIVRRIQSYRALLGDAAAQVLLLISRNRSRHDLRASTAAE